MFYKRYILLVLILVFLSGCTPTAPDYDSFPEPANTENSSPAEIILHRFTIETDGNGHIPAGQAEMLNGYYAEGDVIRLICQPFQYYFFNCWVSSDGGTFNDENDSTAYFTIPANDVTVTATFKDWGLEKNPLITPH